MGLGHDKDTVFVSPAKPRFPGSGEDPPESLKTSQRNSICRKGRTPAIQDKTVSFEKPKPATTKKAGAERPGFFVIKTNVNRISIVGILRIKVSPASCPIGIVESTPESGGREASGQRGSAAFQESTRRNHGRAGSQ